jgi:hypothetical protein
MLTQSVALSVSLFAAAAAHANIKQCSSEQFSAWSDLSSGGTGKIYLNVKAPSQTPNAIEGVLQGTFNKDEANALIQNHCKTGTLILNENLTVSQQPLKNYELATADKKKSIDVTNRNNDSDYALKDNFKFTQENGYQGRISLRSATIFLETGTEPYSINL